MNTQQLKIILTVAETASISRAARELYLSQPTVSNSIMTVENEVGFQIFERTNRGISVTDRGRQMLRHASVVAEQMEAIGRIAEEEIVRRFRLIAPSSLRIERAFARFCRRYCRSEKLQFSMYAEGIGEAVDSLYQGKADMAIAFCPIGTVETLSGQMRQKDVLYTYLGRQPFVITAAKDHPMNQEELTPETLSKYTCIRYRNSIKVESFIPETMRVAIGTDRVIRVESRELRMKLASQGIGFLAGTPIDPAELEQYGLISRPAYGLSGEMGYMVPKARQREPLVKEFLQLLLEELRTIDGFQENAELKV